MHQTFRQFSLPRIDDILFLSWWVGWTLSCVCQRGDSYTVAYDKVISQRINLAQLNAHPEMGQDLIFNFRLTVSIAAGVPLQNVQVVNITAGSIHIAYRVGRLHKNSISIWIGSEHLSIAKWLAKDNNCRRMCLFQHCADDPSALCLLHRAIRLTGRVGGIHNKLYRQNTHFTDQVS